MKRFAIHNTGELVRDRYGRATGERESSTVQEFDTLDSMHPFDRAQFDWMLEHGQVITNTGTIVYQIRRAAQ